MSNSSQDPEAGNGLGVHATPSQERREGKIYPHRRRLLTGGAAGAGVLLAMQAKTALGGTVAGTVRCQSPSAMLSGNLSHHPHDETTCSGGRSPGFWKQPGNFNLWVGMTAPTFKPGVRISDCTNGMSGVSPCDIAIRGTLLNAIFSGAPAFGVWEALIWPTNYPTATDVGTSSCALTGGQSDVFGGKGQLLRHLSCAYLNAGAIPSMYPITQAQVIAMWNAVKNGGTYCPTGPSGPGCAMTADDIIAYISGMYDVGVDDGLEGCKKY